MLSTSALRGRLARVHDARRVEVAGLPRAPAALLASLRFRLVGEPGGGRTIARARPGGRLELAEPLDVEPDPDAACELVSDEEAPILAARLLTRTAPPAPLPRCSMRLATTLGTNLLLERAGAPFALFVTRGFGDVLTIGTQQRPDLFALAIDERDTLAAAVVEVPGRLAADGSEVEPLDLAKIEPQVLRLVDEGVRVAAVALVHAWRDDRHEALVARRLLELGFEHVSRSAELSPRIGLLGRAATAAVDAFVAPRLASYVERVRSAQGEGGLLVMTSAGGLVPPGRFRPKDGLLSGPAGGVVGAAAAARAAGIARILTFDMGGTSTDVSRVAGELELADTHRVGNVTLVAPAVAVETVAAGGGSICRLEGGRLRVGPASAGARPGPACYGAGGPLCLTDVNLLLGRLDPERFEIPIRVEPARERLNELCREIERASGEAPDPDAVLEGLIDVADETMAGAMRRVSVRRGHDPADHVLVAFGGAGGQHAAGVAERLGVGRVLWPPRASVLSARGVGEAALERIVDRQVLRPLDEVRPELGVTFDDLAEAARAELEREDPRARTLLARRLLRLRFAGQDSTVEIDWTPRANLRARFEKRYEALYGHRPEARPIEVESLRLVARVRERVPPRSRREAAEHEATPAGRRRARLGGARVDVPWYERGALGPGATLAGPALVFERDGSLVVPAGWTARREPSGGLLLERDLRAPAVRRGGSAETPEAVRLELYTRRFATIVEEMGERLARTAVSTNVRERLDYSCALLDPAGRLVVHAPHVPVHLGALGLCVRRVAEALAPGPGDVAVTNHPAHGGSHLPDVTVITPVHDGERLLGWVASRAHHAEIGGTRPGSMPPRATRLVEEGVVLPPAFLARRGVYDWEGMRRRFLDAPHPTRTVEDNLADLRAAAAANHAGASGLVALTRAEGASTVAAYMERLRELAASELRSALSRLPAGEHVARQTLDDGTPLVARFTLDGERARIDFAGSGGVHPGNLNATPAIVHSVVLYVLRLLVARELPLNEGLLEPIDLALPRGLLDPPFPDDPREAPAVVGGNVETSQRLVDTLLAALDLAACSQGTMNNVLFGNERYGYYETLGGGAGAIEGRAGASAVHTHMTNTRITDVEVLESRYPVRVERFAIRRGSGGAGRWRGGDGLVREIRFLEPAAVSVLTQHRTVAPYGARGGGPGACGRQRVVRASGEVVALASIDACDVAPGDRLIVETPGGGGWGGI